MRVEVWPILKHPDATAVSAGVVFDGAYVCSVGVSRRATGDKHDPELADALAMARALDGLSSKLMRRARGRVKQTDWVKEQRAKVEAERTTKQAQAAKVVEHLEVVKVAKPAKRKVAKKAAIVVKKKK
jgi:hypothetical protein